MATRHEQPPGHRGPQKTPCSRTILDVATDHNKLAWRSSHEDSLGQLPPQARELVRVPQVLDDLFQLSLGLRAPLHIAEGANGLFGQHFLQQRLPSLRSVQVSVCRQAFTSWEAQTESSSSCRRGCSKPRWCSSEAGVSLQGADCVSATPGSMSCRRERERMGGAVQRGVPASRLQGQRQHFSAPCWAGESPILKESAGRCECWCSGKQLGQREASTERSSGAEPHPLQHPLLMQQRGTYQVELWAFLPPP